MGLEVGEIGILPDTIFHKDIVYPASTVPFLWDIAESRIKELHDRGIDGRGVNVVVMDTGWSDHTNLPKPYYLNDFTGSRNGTRDVQGHGSWCNGRIAGTGGIGIAPGCSVGHIKVLGDEGSGRTDWSELGRLDAARNGAHLLSVSIGGPCVGGTRLEDSMRKANELGTLLEIDAAGNSGFNGRRNTIDCPGKALTGFAVGAYRRDGNISGFSSGGREIDVACPGEQVISTSHHGSGWSTSSGTSMATPFFTGIMALVVQKRRQLGVPDSNMIGADVWREFFQSEGITDRAIEDAGQPGKDNRYGLGKPFVYHIVEWLGDYKFA